MDNKKILSKLVKIAHNQQQVLNKLAEMSEGDITAVENALNDFIKYQLVSWGLPREVAAKESHVADRRSGSKHFDVNLTLTLADKNKKSVVEDPATGFGKWLQDKFAQAAQDPKWKALGGYTAKFTVSAN
jgi:hypothetical protein